MSAPAAVKKNPLPWLILPLVVLAGLIAILVFTRPLDELTASAELYFPEELPHLMREAIRLRGR